MLDIIVGSDNNNTVCQKLYELKLYKADIFFFPDEETETEMKNLAKWTGRLNIDLTISESKILG